MYVFLRLVSFLICCLPQIFVEYLAKFFAFLAFYVFRIRRKVIIINLKMVFGSSKSEKELNRIAWHSTQSFFYTIFECLYSPRLSLTKNSIETASKRIVDKYVSKGAFVIVGHMSNWEAAGALVNKYNPPAYALVKQVGGRGVHNFVSWLRKTNKFNTIETKDKAPKSTKGKAIREIFKYLQNGYWVGFPLDQYRRGDMKIDFFGKKVATNTMLGSLWIKKKVPVIGAYSLRRSFGVHELFFLDSIESRLESADDKIELVCAELNKLVEQIILACPEQYFWFHRRWKNVVSY